MFTKPMVLTNATPVFSVEPERQALELEFLGRLSRFLELSNTRDRFVELATKGKIQEIFPDLDQETVPATPIPYDSLEPFNYDVWAKGEWGLSAREHAKLDSKR